MKQGLHWHATVLTATTKQSLTRNARTFAKVRSPALNMIAVEQLLVFDPVSTTTIYSRSDDGGRRRHHVIFSFDITSDVFPCTPSEDDLTQATVLVLTWVSAATYIPQNIYALHKIISFVPWLPPRYCNSY